MFVMMCVELVVFDRLFFCRDDPIVCPVAVVVAGSHADVRDGGAHVRTPPPPERELRQQVEERFDNFDRRLVNVTYVECSARTRHGARRRRAGAARGEARASRAATRSDKAGVPWRPAAQEPATSPRERHHS